MRLAPGKLPTDAGAIVLDAVAAIAIGAVARGTAVIARQPLAVRDHRSEVSLLADIWRGMRASDVLRELGLIRAGDYPPPTRDRDEAPPRDAGVIDSGAPSPAAPAPPPTPLDPSPSPHLPLSPSSDPSLRGGDFLREKMLPLDCVLDGGEILLHLTAGAAPPPAEPCIRCGWCLDICPTHVHPAGVLESAQRQDDQMAQRFGAAACIECGLCSYICPSHLPLMPAAQMMKNRG